VQLAKLREWREARGLTQKQLAAKAGVAEGTVVRGERGETTYPHTARKMADALDVSVADLMENPPVPLVGAPESGQPEPGRLITRNVADPVGVSDEATPTLIDALAHIVDVWRAGLMSRAEAEQQARELVA
jgi:transcriptional regulator with XRE-family HTH domain